MGKQQNGGPNTKIIILPTFEAWTKFCPNKM